MSHSKFNGHWLDLQNTMMNIRSIKNNVLKFFVQIPKASFNRDLFTAFLGMLA